MSRDFSGEEIVRVLRNMNYQIVGRSGSHAILKYEHPKTGEVRRITVPLRDNLPEDALRRIADQTGAEDFQSWKRWIKSNK